MAWMLDMTSAEAEFRMSLARERIQVSKGAPAKKTHGAIPHVVLISSLWMGSYGSWRSAATARLKFCSHLPMRGKTSNCAILRHRGY